MSATLEELLLVLKERGYHVRLHASEGHRHKWLAAVRGSQEVGGDTPTEAVAALLVWVDKAQPMTTAQLRKQGAQ